LSLAEALLPTQLSLLLLLTPLRHIKLLDLSLDAELTSDVAGIPNFGAQSGRNKVVEFLDLINRSDVKDLRGFHFLEKRLIFKVVYHFFLGVRAEIPCVRRFRSSARKARVKDLLLIACVLSRHHSVGRRALHTQLGLIQSPAFLFDAIRCVFVPSTYVLSHRPMGLLDRLQDLRLKGLIAFVAAHRVDEVLISWSGLRCFDG
jgi:hypothetical protein